MKRPRNRYQFDREWLDLIEHIKWTRADGQCECEGQCGSSHKFGVFYRCPHKHGAPGVHGRDKTVSLTVTHLDGDEANNDEQNLAAMCQSCVSKHRANLQRKAVQIAERLEIEAAHDSLFDIEAL